ncbi:MAG: hypothetical protein KIT72_12225 [Polyangiaceae bacterium]|nr:hypothetical protein [Polyangiaceae bacterium]MCW5791180.1 hypothetical protein [Polyangiaceae bacterium]
MSQPPQLPESPLPEVSLRCERGEPRGLRSRLSGRLTAWLRSACGGLLGLGVLGLGACDFGEEDARIPGDPLGTFQVTARLTDSSCGPGALGSEDLWEFQVELAADGAEIYWLNGDDPVAGRLAADQVSFAFDSAGTVQLIEPRPGMPGCAVTRTDRASGVLDAAGDVRGFSGSLSYGFVPGAGSDCSEAIGVEGGFYTLPCEIRYTMRAERIAAPN